MGCDQIESAKSNDPGFDIYWLGVAFERINTFAAGDSEMLLLIDPVSIKELQDFFNDWRRNISESLKT